MPPGEQKASSTHAHIQAKQSSTKTEYNLTVRVRSYVPTEM